MANDPKTDDLALIDRYWRAAAWILERKNPDDFAPRKPNVVTEEQMKLLFGQGRHPRSDEPEAAAKGWGGLGRAFPSSCCSLQSPKSSSTAVNQNDAQLCPSTMFEREA